MVAEQYDIDQPVELRLRGDAVDLFGALVALLGPALEKGEAVTDNERANAVIEDLSMSINQQVNLGWYMKETKRRLREGDIPDYRGIQVLVDEFDAQHPELSGDLAERMTPLEKAEVYAIISLTERGFETGAWPDSIDDLEVLQLASMCRIYARDLERSITENAIDLREDGEG